MQFCKGCYTDRPITMFGQHRQCETCRASRKASYQRHRDEVLRKAAIYRAAHKPEERVARLAHYQRNKEHVAKVTKAYRLANLALYANAASKRRAVRLKATPPWANEETIRHIYTICARVRKQTGKPFEVDHIVPLQGRNVCGLHCPANLQLLEQTHNRRKSRTHHVV